MKQGNKFTGKIFCVEGDRYEPAKLMVHEYTGKDPVTYFEEFLENYFGKNSEK